MYLRWRETYHIGIIFSWIFSCFYQKQCADGWCIIMPKHPPNDKPCSWLDSWAYNSSQKSTSGECHKCGKTTILTVYLSGDSPDCKAPQSDPGTCSVVVKLTVSEWEIDDSRPTLAAGQTICHVSEDNITTSNFLLRRYITSRHITLIIVKLTQLQIICHIFKVNSYAALNILNIEFT